MSSNNAYALSLALKDSSGRYLFGLRSDKNKSYRRCWSLPSSHITRQEYDQVINDNQLSASALATLVNKCFTEDVALRVTPVKIGLRQRNDKCLHMIVAEGELPGKVQLQPDKYLDQAYWDMPTALTKMHDRVGTCSSLLIQHLIETDQIDSATPYLELSPALADSDQPLEDYSQDELWSYAAANYGILREGESGGDGDFIRRSSLDLYLQQYLDASAKGKALDLGCGSGDLVQRMKNSGFEASGVDLYPDPLQKHPELNLVKGHIDQAHTLLEVGSYQLVTLNLVCQWIEDLPAVAQACASLLSGDGRLLVTMVPPEYAKNGHWQKRQDEYDWIITEPLRREPFLVMINRSVGPLWYYPRSTYDYIHTFTEQGLCCTDTSELFLDSLISEKAWQDLQAKRPDLRRHQKFPVFSVLEFRK